MLTGTREPGRIHSILGYQYSVPCRTLGIDSSYPSTISFASYYGSVTGLVTCLDFKSSDRG